MARIHQYLNFDVTIEPSDNGVFPVRVVWPEGEHHGRLRLPDVGERQRLLEKVEEVVQRRPRRPPGPSSGRHAAAHQHGRRHPAHGDALVELGGVLFEALMVGPVRAAFDATRRRVEASPRLSLRVRLRIHDAELAALPWEMLYDARRAPLGFIAKSRTTPVVRQIDTDFSPPPRAPTPVRILGVGFSPGDAPGHHTSREHRKLEAAMQRVSTNSAVHLSWLNEQITWDDVGAALCEDNWHILHFVGDGDFDRTRDEGSVTLIDNRGERHTLSGTRFTALVRESRALRLVVLNACDGARGSPRSAFSSTAAQLVRQGIPAVLAMQFKISDAAAVQFATVLYRSLAAGMALESAVAEARNRVELSPNLSDTLEWATPVLYTRGLEGRLFSRAERTPAVTPLNPGPRPTSVPSMLDLDQRWVNAVQLMHTGKVRDAVGALKTLLEKKPDARTRALIAQTSARVRIAGLYQRAEAAVMRQDWRKAIDLLRPIIEQSPDYEQAEELFKQATLNFQVQNLYSDAQELASQEKWVAVLNTLDKLRAVQPSFADPDRLRAHAQAALRNAQREREIELLYAQGQQALNASDWASAARALEQVAERRPDYRQTATLLKRAGRAMAREADPELLAATPQHSRALAYCLLYEMAPERYSSYLPRLIKALEHRSNTVQPDPLFRNLLDVVGLPTLARHLIQLDPATRPKLAQHLARQLDAPRREVDTKAERVIRDEVAKALTNHIGLEQLVDDQHRRGFVMQYGSTTPEELLEQIHQHGAALRTSGDILDYVIRDADVA